MLSVGTIVHQSHVPAGACADVALGPAVLSLVRFGATFKEFPNLAKYAETVKVSAAGSSIL